ncbi:MAG: hypothetical protein ACP5RW_08240, partial [bacterium]
MVAVLDPKTGARYTEPRLAVEGGYYGTYRDLLQPYGQIVPYGFEVSEDRKTASLKNPSAYALLLNPETGSYDKVREEVYNKAVEIPQQSMTSYYEISYYGQGVPSGKGIPKLLGEEEQELPFNPAIFFEGKPYLCSFDFDPAHPGPILEFMLNGRLCVACGEYACRDVKRLLAASSGSSEQLTLPFDIAPTMFIIGGPTPIFGRCDEAPLCWQICVMADSDDCSCSEWDKCIPYKKHRYYGRLVMFATF